MGCSLLLPFQTSAIVSDDLANPIRWRYLFFSATAFYALAALLYCLLARFEPEPFNLDRAEEANQSPLMAQEKEIRRKPQVLRIKRENLE